MLSAKDLWRGPQKATAFNKQLTVDPLAIHKGLVQTVLPLLDMQPRLLCEILQPIRSRQRGFQKKLSDNFVLILSRAGADGCNTFCAREEPLFMLQWIGRLSF